MSPNPPSGRTNWQAVVFGLALAWFAAYQMFKLPPVLPVLLETYGYDRTLAGGFMSIYAVAGLLLSVGFGRRVARGAWHGPLLGALGSLAAGNLLALAWPQSGWAMLAARGLEGTGFTLLAIVGPTLANRHAAERHLPIIIGFTASWIPLGQLSAALAAPAALALQGWQGLWGLALGGCLAFALWSRRVAEGRPTVAASAPAPDEGAGESGAGGAGRTLIVLAAAIFLLWAGQFFAYMTWLPQYLVEVHGLALSSALAGYGLPVAVLICFNLLTGVLLRRGAPLGGLMLGALAVQTAVWWLIPFTGSGWDGLVSLVAYGVGAGITPTCLFAMPSLLAGRGQATAAAFGVLMTGRNIGVLIGPILLAEALRYTGAWDLASPIFGTVTALALLAAARLAARIPHRSFAVPR